MRKTKKRNKRRRRVSTAGALLLGGIALLGIWFGDAIHRAFAPPPEAGQTAWQTEPSQVEMMEEPETTLPMTTETPDSSEIPTETTPIIDAGLDFLTQTGIPEGYIAVTQGDVDLHDGILVQIDQNHPFEGTQPAMTTFQGKNESYRMKKMDLAIAQETLDAMNRMGQAYVSATGAVNLMVYSTTAAYGVEGSLYPDWLPDRSTGYCVDLCLLNEDATISKFTEQNAWLRENCWKYGFVFSYTEADAGSTGVSAAPYHLRYVGEVHSGLIHENGLTLNSYYSFLRSHTLDVPLYYTIADASYMVYYVPAINGSAQVPVPLSGEYTLSGDNSEGFIVTVKQPVTPVTE